MTPRLGLTFHRTFSLVRPAVSQVVQLAVSIRQSSIEGPGFTRELIRERTNLGSIYVEAMPRYARGSGLLDDRNRLTPFGYSASQADKGLESLDTQWLMHYFMSASTGPGPLFWHELCATRFRVGNRFTRQEIADDIATLYKATEGKSVSASALKSTTTIFLGTYTKSDGLGNLGILYQDDDHYVVTQPDAPSPWVVGYALIDDWERRYPGRLSINLDDLSDARGLASPFMLDEDTLLTALISLQRAGVVDLYRSARPYQLLLLAHDRQIMLRRVYGVDDSYPTA